MAHVKHLGLFPPWFAERINRDPSIYWHIFKQVETIPPQIEKRGFCFTPLELADFYWNCRRIKIEYTFKRKAYHPDGWLYHEDDPVTHSYYAPMAWPNSYSTKKLYETGERCLAVNNVGYAVPEMSHYWVGKSSRLFWPDHATGAPEPLWHPHRVYFNMFINFENGPFLNGAYHTEPITHENYNKKILWPVCSINFALLGLNPFADSFITTESPTGDNTNLAKRGTCKFFDFKEIPIYVVWPGNYSDAAYYFNLTKTTVDIKITWDKKDQNTLWPYALEESDPSGFARYRDNYDGMPDLLGNY